MIGPRVYRGQPLVVLGLLVGGWIAMRAIMWDSAVTPMGPASLHSPAAAGMTLPEPAIDEAVARAAPSSNPAPQWSPMPLPRVNDPGRTPSPRAPYAPAARPSLPATRLPASAPAHIAAGHQLMWMAALTRLPAPSFLKPAAYLPPQAAPAHAPSAPARVATAPQRPGRWSADAWLLLRRGGAGSQITGVGPASYGASQGGGVARYRLDPGSGHRPASYLRATAALNGSREKEAALGLSLRPLPQVPVVAAAEARLTSVPGATRARPAAFAYTELPPVGLPLGARAEAYLQAGYVGGSFATGFVDGQVRLDHGVTRLGPADLRAGGGVWGGAQRGASRLDVGPSATLIAAGSGTAAARLGIDWRFRVAGNAAPGSGPAVTLSAGF